MYRSRWKGSHYEAGFKYGDRIYKLGINPLENIPLTDERREFARESLEIYNRFYPEIVEEIKGISDRLRVDFNEMIGFLFTMYACTCENKCSSIAIRDGDGKATLFWKKTHEFFLL